MYAANLHQPKNTPALACAAVLRVTKTDWRLNGCGSNLVGGFEQSEISKSSIAPMGYFENSLDPEGNG